MIPGFERPACIQKVIDEVEIEVKPMTSTTTTTTTTKITTTTTTTDLKPEAQTSGSAKKDIVGAYHLIFIILVFFI